MDWERRFLEILHASRPAYDEAPDWRGALQLYHGLSGAEALGLDRALLAMIDEDYRNPHSSRENLPFDDVMVNLPAGMAPDDLLCIEAAVLMAAERKLGEALFAFNRLMRAPRWHALSPRLYWLNQQGFAAQKRLLDTEAGRTLGALLGLACGDALGVTVEFMERSEVRRQYPDGHTEIIGGGPFRFAAGQWSDDTAMALAVANGIIESPADPVEATGRHFQAWYASHPPDVGSTCRMALETHLRTGSWAATTAEVQRQLGDRAGGNGALMRTLPAALAYGSDPAPALRIARMTHPHPESDAAVTVYQLMVDSLLRGATPQEAFRTGLGVAGPLTERLAATPRLTEDQVQSSGYVVDTLKAAIWSLLTTDSLEACIIRAVNLGDDADTVGAVAGGLAGAAYGALAIPRRWSLALKQRSQLEETAEKLFLLARSDKQ
ncbi:MAG TPA: ADP-ribosylglycohydrolase family protein [Symbiobacteriaceae bacterium]|nr:ADP-ribosylglycohydrolase family protein [Symbiobacteriaceae bacterium]